MGKVALWRVYVSGRFGFEKELGYVIASAVHMDWLKSFASLACDIVEYLDRD